MASIVAANGYLRHALCAKCYRTASGSLLVTRKMSAAPQPRRDSGGAVIRKNPKLWIQHQKSLKREALLKREKQVVLPSTCTPKSLAGTLGVRAVDVLKKMIILGERPRTADDDIPTDLAKLIAVDFKFQPIENTRQMDRHPRELDKDATYPRRPPVVTVIGHIDHGKTTLLDALRKSNVVEKEAGKITQHIGAFTVKIEDGEGTNIISFLDTPGHEAFNSLRERGVKATDIALLVVSADDGIQEQTLEAIRVAKESKVQMMVCITKVDKISDGGTVADTSQLREKLFQHGVEVEGIRDNLENAVPWVEVSAKTGYGMDDLKAAIITQASMMNLTAPVDGEAEGFVLESRMEKGRGPLATVFVTAGTLRVGDYVATGLIDGRIRQLKDHNGKDLQSATPGIPVEIIGLKEVPEPGVHFFCFEAKEIMEAVVAHRKLKLTEKVMNEQHKIVKEEQQNRRTEALESLVESTGKSVTSFNKAQVQEKIAQLEKQKEQNSSTKSISFMLKADVAGSLEGVQKALSVLPQDEVELRLVKASVGPITDGDVMAAKVTGSVLVGFNVKTSSAMHDVARKSDVKIIENSVVYNIVGSIKDLMGNLLAPNIFMDTIGAATVKQMFDINKGTRNEATIAGCLVIDGVMRRGATAQVIRDGKIIHTGKVDTLRSFKSVVPDVKKGSECGVSLSDFDDFRAGDVIKCINRRVVPRKLGDKRIDQSEAN